MNENFRFHKLSTKHKKRFILHQILLFVSIILMGWIGIKVTNPTIIETTDKMSLTFGAMLGVFIIVMAFFNRLKNLLKVKFVIFLVVWILLFTLQSIMSTLIWSIGLVLIPLMIDDIILLPLWNHLWYNTYE